MKLVIVIIAVFIGIVLSAVTGIFYVLSGVSDQGTSSPQVTSPSQFLWGEGFKVALTYTFIVVGGWIIKVLGDDFIEKQRTFQARFSEREARYRSIVDEFVAIFSGFYSLRKRLETMDPSERSKDKKLVQNLLDESAKLEGRYGALKVGVIDHFELPSGEYGTQNTAEVKPEIKKAKESGDLKKEVRKRLDLVGEYYDEWRHALKESRKLKKEIRDDLLNQYETLLPLFRRLQEEQEEEAHRERNAHRSREQKI